MNTSSSFSELFDSDPDYLAALAIIPLSGDTLITRHDSVTRNPSSADEDTALSISKESSNLSFPVHSGKRAHSPDVEHTHNVSVTSTSTASVSRDSEDYIYGASKFGGFGEYMDRKRRKLQIQNDEIAHSSSGKVQIFKGIEIYINGRTEPPLQELRTMIVEHGGRFHAYLDKKSLVTHIIATQLTPAKVKDYARMKVVTPEWIVRSVEKQALLPWRDFIFRVGDVERVDAPARAKNATKQYNMFALRDKDLPPVSPLPLAGGRPSSLIFPSSTPAVDGGRDASRRSSSPEPVMPAEPVKNLQIPSYAPNESNLHATRLMEDPKWRAENTSVAPHFVSNYFRRSRLHHLSTWKSELKILVKHARASAGSSGYISLAQGVSMRGASLVMNKTPTSRAKDNDVTNVERVIMHCDFDSFFVSASLIDRPELRNKPVVVCHSNALEHADAGSTSEIASASYKARDHGVRNGMSLGQARKLCPNVQAIPYEFEKYKEISLKFYNVLLSYADDIEVVSVDEAFIDVSSRVMTLKEKLQSTVRDAAKCLAENIRSDVRVSTACETSIGMSENLLLARIATKKAKPAGSFYLDRSVAAEHLAALPISTLPGFSHHTTEKIKDKWNITTCGEVRQTIREESAAQKVLGPGTGHKLWTYVVGEDDRELKPEELRKSVSAAINYAIRFETHDQAQTFMNDLGKEVASRLEADSLLGRSLTLTIMRRAQDAPFEPPKFLGHGSCDTFNYSAPISGADGSATADPVVIAAQAWKLCQAHHSADTTDLRGIGISIHQLETELETKSNKQSRLPFATKTSPVDKSKVRMPAHVKPPSRYTALGSRDSPIPIDSPDDHASSSKIPEIDIQAAPPSKATEDAKRIIRQLAPTRSKVTSPTKYSIFHKREKTPVAISDAELRELELDPEVFRAIPADMQREQLAIQRMLHRNSRSSTGPSRTSVPRYLAARDSRSRSRSKSAAPFVKANIKAKPAVAPVLKKAKTTEELQELVSKWVDTHAESGPEPEAVDRIRGFLLQCIDEKGLGDVGVEKVSAVMQWWLHKCRQRGGDLDPSEAIEADVESTTSSVLWWRAFYLVKLSLDEVIAQRFGGSLSLG